MGGDVWYLDSTAFVKLVRVEPETEALQHWLRNQKTCSSDLLRTEVRRAVIDEPEPVRRLCEAAVGALTLVRLTPEIFDRAGATPGLHLRSLDALHLEAARAVGDDLAGIVAYDHRLRSAATDVGIDVAAPT